MNFRIFIFGMLFLATTRPTATWIINGITCKIGDQIIRQTLSSEGVLTQLLTENTISDIGQNGSFVVLNNTISGTTRVIEMIGAGGAASKEFTVTKNLNGTSQLTIHGWSRISTTEKPGCRKINDGNINWHNTLVLNIGGSNIQIGHIGQIRITGSGISMSAEGLQILPSKSTMTFSCDDPDSPCSLKCTGKSSCQALSVEENIWAIECEENSCQDLTARCSKGQSCSVSCNGLSACEGAIFHGKWQISCDGISACQGVTIMEIQYIREYTKYMYSIICKGVSSCQGLSATCNDYQTCFEVFSNISSCQRSSKWELMVLGVLEALEARLEAIEEQEEARLEAIEEQEEARLLYNKTMHAGLE